MPEIYTVTFREVTWAAASGDIDLLSIDPAADHPTHLLGWGIYPTSELQEAHEEWLKMSVIRGHTTVGSGGAAATARPLRQGGQAYGGSVRTNDTTVASVGTAINLWDFGVQVRAGDVMGPVPEHFDWQCLGAELLVVRLTVAVTDDVTASASFWIAEY
jgi:hypothetical protein